MVSLAPTVSVMVSLAPTAFWGICKSLVKTPCPELLRILLHRDGSSVAAQSSLPSARTRLRPRRNAADTIFICVMDITMVATAIQRKIGVVFIVSLGVLFSIVYLRNNE